MTDRPSNEDVSFLLDALTPDGSEKASGTDLFPLVYDELRALAASRMAGENNAHTLQATALVHEVWLRLCGSGDRRWQDRTHFLRVAALAMRRILVENARRKTRQKRGAGFVRVELNETALLTTDADERILLVDAALARLEQVDPPSARIVGLKFFGNYSSADIADMLGMSERSVERAWTYARARLMRFIREET
jgi:RNA polymerase sigma factor (TIGR02999 family)